MNQLLGQGRVYDKSVFMLLSGRMFRSNNNIQLQRAFTPRHISVSSLSGFTCCSGLHTAQGFPVLLVIRGLCSFI